MGTVFLYHTLCAYGVDNSGCHEVRTQAFASATACYAEGARRVNGNVASQSGHFVFIECRP